MGLEYHCPICGLSVSEMKDYDRKRGRNNCQCWKCGSLERHRFTYLFLQMYLGFFKDKRKNILHIAPEKCLYEVFKDYRLYVTANIFENRITKELFDITAIPHKDSSFDLIYCSHVLEHVDDDIQALREFKRTLKPGGRGRGHIVLDLPVRKDLDVTYEDFSLQTAEERKKAFGQEDHVRAYGKDIIDRIRSAGLTVENYYPSELFTPAEMKYYGLTDERLFLCR